MMDTPTDAQLVWKIREEGNMEAFGGLVSRYDKRMKGLAMSVLGQEAEAQDAVQDALIRAYQNLGALADPDRVGGWLLRIVFGCSVDRLRRRNASLSEIDVSKHGEPCDRQPLPESPLDAREWAQHVIAAIARLPSRYRRPLLLFHMDGLSTREVAAYLGVPPGTVRSLLTRSRDRLRSMLEGDSKEMPEMVGEVFREQAAAAGLLDRPGCGGVHVMNGDAAANKLLASGMTDPVVVWSDILHEGPTPGGQSVQSWRDTRARHLAGMGFGDVESLRIRQLHADEGMGDLTDGRERTFWFEHDLYDQLLLVRHLAVLSRLDAAVRCPISLICIGAFPGIPRFIGLGQLEPDQIASLLNTRQPIGNAHLEFGREVWDAFCAPGPTRILNYAHADSPLLPYLKPALIRHLQQYPSVYNGLGRTEQTILELLAETPADAAILFARHQAVEQEPFLGDAVFYWYLRELASEASPAIRLLSDDPCVTTQTCVELTDVGRGMLAGDLDRVRVNGIDRWFGGVWLNGTGPVWRWDELGQTLVFR